MRSSRDSSFADDGLRLATTSIMSTSSSTHEDAAGSSSTYDNATTTTTTTKTLTHRTNESIMVGDQILLAAGSADDDRSNDVGGVIGIMAVDEITESICALRTTTSAGEGVVDAEDKAACHLSGAFTLVVLSDGRSGRSVRFGEPLLLQHAR